MDGSYLASCDISCLQDQLSKSDLDSERMFPMVGESRTRGHSLRIRDKPFRTEVRRNFLSQRVVNLWNSLSQKVFEAKTLSDFKNKLYIALGAKGIKAYGRKGGIRILNSMISCDQDEWWSRLEGPNGLLLLLVSMSLCFYDGFIPWQEM